MEVSNRLNSYMNSRKRIILETVRQILEAEEGRAPQSKQEIASSLLAAAQQTHGEMMDAYKKIHPEFGIGEAGKSLLGERHPQMLNDIMKTFLNHHPEVQEEIRRVGAEGEGGTWDAVSALIRYPHIHPIGHQIAVMHDEARRAGNDLFGRKDYTYPSPGSNYWWTRGSRQQ